MHDRTSRPPATRAPLLTAALIFVLFSTGGTLPTPLYSLYQQEFHFSEIMLTLIFAVYVLGTLAMLAFFGRLSDQIGRSRTVLIAAVLAFASTMLFIFDLDIPMLFFGRLFSGASVGLSAGALTAWLAELYPGEDKSHATLWAGGSNLFGLGFGPLMTGLLVAFAPLPHRLTYILFLLLLALIVILALNGRETIEQPVTRLGALSLKPRFGVPAGKRQEFLPPAVTVFCSFAMMGFYTALLPGVLSHSLGLRNPAIAGAVIFGFFLAGTASIAFLRRLSPAAAMLSGIGALVPSLGLLILAERLHGLGLLLGASALGGAAVALGYRGSLQRVNAMSGAENKAEMVSTYFLFAYVGIALPVIGIGIIAQLTNAPLADMVFAIIIAGLAILAFLFGLRHRNDQQVTNS